MRWLARQSRKKSVNKVVMTLWVLAVVAALFGPPAWRWVDHLSCRHLRSLQMCSLAGAIHFYQKRYGALPERLETIEATGLYGSGAYRSPASGWEDWDKHTGPSPHYLPVQVWDGHSEIIVAVERRRPHWLKKRSYVMLGSTDLHVATDEEIEALLAEDNRKREAMGDPFRWPENLVLEVEGQGGGPE